MYGGSSFTTFDDLCAFMLQHIKPKRVLDIGPGEGKYGRMVRSCDMPQPHLTAVEYEPLRRDELLTLGYDEVRTMSALDLMKKPAEEFDFVILGDVIEHFRKSEGQDLLEYLNYRCKYMLIVTPECMPMSSPDFYEGHNSLWRPESMMWHDLWAHCRNASMHLYLLRGYLDFDEPIHLENVVAQANMQPFMSMITSPHQAPLPRALSLHDTILRDPYPPGISTRYRPI
jgi:aryl carrier-like protein